MDEALDLGLHPPVLEFDSAQLVGAHDGLAIGQRQFATLPFHNLDIILYKFLGELLCIRASNLESNFRSKGLCPSYG